MSPRSPATPDQDLRPVYRSGHWEIDLALRELRAGGKRIPIGGRAFDIIEVLLGAAGGLVAKQDLMSRVWPGVFVEGNALQVHISALRKALGADRGMLTTASGRGYRLLGDWQVEPEDRSEFHIEAEPSQLPTQPFQSNLPVLTSTLFGRAAAARELQELLSAYRAVTLIGPGGIGKTTLALEVAWSLFPSFGGDVLLAELASLSDPNLVPSTAAGVLDLKSTLAELSPEAIARAVGGRKLLLLLDNCEHVIDAAAALAEAFLRMCPHTTILATSREMLRVDGEYTYRVQPLDAPPPEERAGDDILAYSAVQLFIARTRALHSGFVASREDLPAIAAVCRRLDGVPLALEFAAARAATVGVHQVASRLEDRFQLLTQGRRRALPQHRTLRATLDWSYDLLSASEQRLLRHLAVFPGGFMLEGAAFVSGDTIPSATDGISNLVSRSLVTFDTSAPGGRWRLLETIRAYALEKLEENGEAGQALRRQAEFFRNLLVPSPLGSRTQPAVEVLARQAREIDNVRAALDWCFSAQGDATIGVELTSGYIPALTYYALLDEGVERIERALEALGADPDGQSGLQLHAVLGMALLATLGPVQRTTTLLVEALTEAESRGDEDAQLQVLYVLSVAYVNLAEADLSVSTTERFAHIARRSGDIGNLIVANQMLGYTLHFQGRHTEAWRHCEDGLAMVPTWRERNLAIWFHATQPQFGRAVMARILWLRGFVGRGIAEARALLEDMQTVESPVLRWSVLRLAVCPLAAHASGLSAAERALAMITDLATAQNPAWRNITKCLQGKLLIARGEFAGGVAVLRDGLETCNRTGWIAWNPEFLATLAEGLASLGQCAEALAAVERAQVVAERGGESWYLPEILRIKGEVLHQNAGKGSVEQVEVCYRRAIEMARQQTAPSWELRAAISLARLLAARGRVADAREVLAPVHGRFTEGFDTVDLRTAQDLLRSLD